MSALHGWIEARRAAGLVIELDLLDRDLAALRALAQQRDAPRLLWLAGAQVQIWTAAGEQTRTLADFLAAPPEAFA